jgi:fructokinase
VKHAVVAGTGLTVLDRIYAAGHDRPLEALGGSCGNVLVSLAMLGHRVAPVAALGEDVHGDFLLREFRRAGCATDLICQKADRGSPVIVEHIDPVRVRHWFSFSCPDTLEAFPRWRSIDEEQVRLARDTLEEVLVFYTDRLSPAIVSAMETARDAGTIVFFEPAMRSEEALLARAMRTVSILKLSDETAGDVITGGETAATAPPAVIRTHGVRGLTASLATAQRFFPAQPAPRLVDACGSGDMVTIRLIDHLLRRWTKRAEWSAKDFFAGVESGQRLAALNCAFARAGPVSFPGRQTRAVAPGRGLGAPFITHAMTFGPTMAIEEG